MTQKETPKGSEYGNSKPQQQKEDLKQPSIAQVKRKKKKNKKNKAAANDNSIDSVIPDTTKI